MQNFAFGQQYFDVPTTQLFLKTPTDAAATEQTLSIGAIAGIAVGAIIGVALMALAAFKIRSRPFGDVNVKEFN